MLRVILILLSLILAINACCSSHKDKQNQSVDPDHSNAPATEAPASLEPTSQVTDNGDWQSVDPDHSNGPATEAPAPLEPTNPVTDNGNCPNQDDYCKLTLSYSSGFLYQSL